MIQIKVSDFVTEQNKTISDVVQKLMNLDIQHTQWRQQ